MTRREKVLQKAARDAAVEIFTAAGFTLGSRRYLEREARAAAFDALFERAMTAARLVYDAEHGKALKRSGRFRDAGYSTGYAHSRATLKARDAAYWALIPPEKACHDAAS